MVCSGFLVFFPTVMLFVAEGGFHHLPMVILSSCSCPPPCPAPLGLINFFCLVQFPSLHIISYITSVLISGSIISYFQAPLRIAINTMNSSLGMTQWLQAVVLSDRKPAWKFNISSPQDTHLVIAGHQFIKKISMYSSSPYRKI